MIYNNIKNGSYINEQYGAIRGYRLLRGPRGQKRLHSTGNMLTVNTFPCSYRDIALNSHPALQH